MKKKKISGLSLGKRTVSSLKASSLSGGTGSYFNCWTFAPPCVSATEPPEDETFFCTPPTGTNQTITCNQSCVPQDCQGTGPGTGPGGPGTTVTQ